MCDFSQDPDPKTYLPEEESDVEVTLIPFPLW